MWQTADDLPHERVREPDNRKNLPCRKRKRRWLRGRSLPIEKQSPGCCWRSPTWPESGIWTNHTLRSVPRPFLLTPRLKPTGDGELPERKARAESAPDHQPPADARGRWYQRRPCLLRTARAIPAFISSIVTCAGIFDVPPVFSAAATAARISSSVLVRPPETTRRPSASKLHTRLSPA